MATVVNRMAYKVLRDDGSPDARVLAPSESDSKLYTTFYIKNFLRVDAFKLTRINPTRYADVLLGVYSVADTGAYALAAFSDPRMVMHVPPKSSRHARRDGGNGKDATEVEEVALCEVDAAAFEASSDANPQILKPNRRKNPKSMDYVRPCTPPARLHAPDLCTKRTNERMDKRTTKFYTAARFFASPPAAFASSTINTNAENANAKEKDKEKERDAQARALPVAPPHARVVYGEVQSGRAVIVRLLYRAILLRALRKAIDKAAESELILDSEPMCAQTN
ncbi:hypothetical protein DFH11DRAFT_1548156 [Phellopilus nigrolimitatus]|nr:hypothetical protein DFH11DRAFT_1548156 [Phellopilus nigrolimitatus]